MYWHQQTWISTLIIFNARHPRGEHKVNTRKLNVELILVVSRSLSLTPTPISTFSDFPAKCAFFFLFMSVRSSGRPYVCLSACPHVGLSVCRLSVCLSLHLSICLSAVRVSAYCVCLLSECLSVSPFIHLSVCYLKRMGFCMSERPWRYVITLFPDRPLLLWQIETRNRLSLWPSSSPIVSLLVGLFVSPSLGPSVGIFSIQPFVCAAFLTAWWRLLEN